MLYALHGKRPKGSVRMILSRFSRKRDIEKISKNNVVFFKITTKGRQKVEKEFCLSKTPGHWDGKWRIFIGRTVIGFQDVSFGKLGRLVYLSPFPIDKTRLSKDHLTKDCLIFEANNPVYLDGKALASKIWKLEELLISYQTWMGKAYHALSAKDISDNLFLEYKKIVSRDPFLSKELLSPNWPYKSCVELFLKLLSIRFSS